ncbi:30S ribosomal protein S6 [Candidatus Uhrbacteria bacterium RIFCSPLOWO2_01_FULL_47_24]|uniref:Small ribosomal subunit protein bS6 n=1 Tax=Candidatus Uhrbacteria bacterium RIFCSPLOWO2_01_FULL_47_24 TaxID=1802401 RepID=A0A1F7UUW0_9BACT|nr:MAG: 30S ribosomal protein S6 [Candidatus Uhrbacteria bacterium RIFCSPHIGHO2_01_FULL_47_11]OGL69137.1 MAG: 30S ribosomal protein S6 [Candidatus Uhrbacteria bacterium RIFCSPHIGHO2_02_FULL_46_47]OGL74792.1 MAG: 30S ribosomal protein S6 [Candidatus Uhrbacteria bacterium RIFCSPHIGHO2_12_FULL_47_11]OGL81508.1 MAG: 30S ribosomal protein S6 [Candidatus Uhrbacteria bacterium RIFCSPLOWO2_01_FULL_47_24]OGL83753.1 MAG: 30S ribosomal protein S6 [Candidatus Uhrbacteria bacterium RIFCSPLOWO2_02_FULL_46_25
MQKYELLALFPLTGTDEEMKALALKIEERISGAHGTVHASTSLQKGPLAYALETVRQGYYQMIQFEMEPKVVAEFRRALILSGEVLRFTISKLAGEFKAFAPSQPRVAPGRTPRVPQPVSAGVFKAPMPTSPVAPSTLSQETIVKEATPKVSMEELDKRLEQILGE